MSLVYIPSLADMERVWQICSGFEAQRPRSYHRFTKHKCIYFLHPNKAISLAWMWFHTVWIGQIRPIPSVPFCFVLFLLKVCKHCCCFVRNWSQFREKGNRPWSRSSGERKSEDASTSCCLSGMPSSRSACQAPCGSPGRPEKTELLEDSGLVRANTMLMPGRATVASVC